MENSCLSSLPCNCFFISQSWPIIKKMATINITSLNKTDVQNFRQKFLFTLKIIWVLSGWIISQDNLSLYLVYIWAYIWRNLFMIMKQWSEWMEKQYSKYFWIQGVVSTTFYHSRYSGLWCQTQTHTLSKV